MARRWTPQRFVTLRRIRVIACIAATSIALAGSFAFTARKSVALNINGQTTQVTTYAMTATRLLEEQGVDIKTHDIVTTSSGDQLANHAVVTVQSAYQTTIDVSLCKQFRCCFCVYRTAVLNTNSVCCSFVIHFCYTVTNSIAHFLCLVRCSCLSCSDCPDWLICNNHVFNLVCCNSCKIRFNLKTNPIHCNAHLSLLK